MRLLTYFHPVVASISLVLVSFNKIGALLLILRFREKWEKYVSSLEKEENRQQENSKIDISSSNFEASTNNRRSSTTKTRSNVHIFSPLPLLKWEKFVKLNLDFFCEFIQKKNSETSNSEITSPSCNGNGRKILSIVTQELLFRPTFFLLPFTILLLAFVPLSHPLSNNNVSSWLLIMRGYSKLK